MAKKLSGTPDTKCRVCNVPFLFWRKSLICKECSEKGGVMFQKRGVMFRFERVKWNIIFLWLNVSDRGAWYAEVIRSNYLNLSKYI